jgi:hypothetical protein
MIIRKGKCHGTGCLGVTFLAFCSFPLESNSWGQHNYTRFPSLPSSNSIEILVSTKGQEIESHGLTTRAISTELPYD